MSIEAEVRLVDLDGSTLICKLRDKANGLFVESVQEPDENVRDIRVEAPRVDGSFRVAEAMADGVLVVMVRVEGSSWAEVNDRWEAVRSAYRSQSRYLVETRFAGVTKRWRAERPDVTPAGLDGSSIAVKRQTYQLRFRVQPRPVNSL